MKLCFAASSGGHLEELCRLEALKKGRDCFLVTEDGGMAPPDFCENVYLVSQINRRELLFLPKLIALFWRSFRILKKEKPDYVISTGALATWPLAVVAKMMKKKVIYIESFARVDTASLTGKMMHPIADLFVVQWEEGLKFFPKAVYGGWIF